MNKEYKLLIIGNIYDNHIVRFVRHLKLQNESANIDCISMKLNKEISKDLIKKTENVYLIDTKISKSQIPYFRSIIYIFKLYFYYNKILSGKKYDIINIHFPTYEYSFLIPILKKHTKRLVITPWGSDVYRIGRIKKIIVKLLYNQSDFVTGIKDRFTEDFKRIFNIRNSKIVDLGIGSEMIDFINTNRKKISQEQAKERFGLSNSYVITIGYNAARAQRHIEILKAISLVKDKLPHNSVFLFPLTYPENFEYVNQIKDTVTGLGFKAIYFEKFLDNESLFCLRQATDIFIHLQTTDANSASIREYILLDKIILNGSWLSYQDLESFGNIPYIKVNSIEDVGENLIHAISLKSKLHNNLLCSYISGMGCIPCAKKWNAFYSSLN